MQSCMVTFFQSDSDFSLQLKESLILRNCGLFVLSAQGCEHCCQTHAANTLRLPAQRDVSIQFWLAMEKLEQAQVCHSKRNPRSNFLLLWVIGFHLYSLCSCHNLYEIDLISPLCLIYKASVSFYFFICYCLKGPCKDKKKKV